MSPEDPRLRAETKERGRTEELLEVGDGPDARVLVVRVSRVADCGEIGPHEAVRSLSQKSDILSRGTQS